MISARENIPKYKVKDPIDLPDQQFFDWCSEYYLINRGVFNVIDNWFFEYGFDNITKRRRIIVRFLKDIHSKDRNEKKLFLQFGKGGVKKSLHYFAGECLNQKLSNKLG